MKLGIMQPYFFPYVGYFELIQRTDQWVVFDTAQYRARSWMNRNRILHPDKGWQYVTAPVASFERFAPISAICLRDPDETLRRILGQLEHYRRRAPHYGSVADLVRRVFEGCENDTLTELNVRGLTEACALLDIPFQCSLFSEMDLDLPEITHPGQWALEISAAMGAEEYVNPPGGRELFDPEAFGARNIRLTITEPADLVYSCRGWDFEPGLSILDVLMWCEPATVRQWLESRA